MDTENILSTKTDILGSGIDENHPPGVTKETILINDQPQYRWPATVVDAPSKDTGKATVSKVQKVRFTLVVLVLPILLGLGVTGLLWRWLVPSPIVHGMVLQSSAALPDFTLDSSLGRTVSLAELSDQHLLVTFGYTSCPDVCPLTLGNITYALNQLGSDAEEVTVLFITVDPERDTVERLATYLPHFHGQMIGLTGSPAELQAVASQFGVFFAQREDSGPDATFFDHTATIMAIDSEGYMRAVFPPTVTGEQLAEDLHSLLRG